MIELNGAVDFTQAYSLAGDIYATAADALHVTVTRRHDKGRPLVTPVATSEQRA